MKVKRLFSGRQSAFGSLVSLTIVTFFGVLYCLALPGFLTSTVGNVYAMLWAAMGITVALAHGRQLFQGSGTRKRQAVYEIMAERPIRHRDKISRRSIQY